MKTMVASAMVWLAAVSPSLAQESADTEARWVLRPQAEFFAVFYPPIALMQGVVGRVVLLCRTRAAQRAECTAQDVTPADWGFGEAAVAMSRSFRFAPAVRNGEVVLDTELRVPITFSTMEAEDQSRAFPVWDEAPPPALIASLWQREDGVRARATLSCTVREDRRLNCEPGAENPRGLGAGAAALRAAEAFRVSERSTAFIARHREAPFDLPLNLGFADEYEPVDLYASRGPTELPPPHPDLARAVYPPEARAGGVGGFATLLCTLRSVVPAECEVEAEQPAGMGFGAAAIELTANQIWADQTSAYIPGDQVRFSVPFVPE